MKTLIIYATKAGSTRKCAELLSKEIGEDCTVVNIKEISTVDINLYDAIVVGTPIRYGSPNKKIVNFCEDNLSIFKSKTTALFFTGMSEKSAVDNAKKVFSVAFCSQCRICSYVGGIVKLENTKGFDRFVIKIVSKAKQKDENFKEPIILEDKIAEIAQIIKK